MADLRDTINTVFPGKRVAIIGDLVGDQFLNGTISRVSREAPVFILRHDKTTTLPGAAANAAVNVKSLGATPVLIGLVGDDENGRKLVTSLEDAGVSTKSVVASRDFSTTTKVRVLAGQHYAARQQVIRIDYENSAEINDQIRTTLRDRLAAAAPGLDAIIVSDYNYGAVFPEIYADARDLAVKLSIPLVVDSRFKLTEFDGATSATPNRDEVEQILGKNFTAADCARLRKQLGYQALLVTNGNEGMTVYMADRARLDIPAHGPAEPVDVTGAGDTVIAAYALGLASGLSHADAASIANRAGGLVVMKKRTASVSADELLVSLPLETAAGSPATSK